MTSHPAARRASDDPEIASGRRPLLGKTVVVTRTRAQASSLVARLLDLGATVVELPVIAVEDPPDGGAALAAAVDRVVGGEYDWVTFTSSNAVERFLSILGGRTIPDDVQWAAVGPGTARTLADGGLVADLVPNGAVSEALAAAFPDASAPPGTVLFPRAESVRGVLAAGLSAKGWTVDEVVAYRTVAGRPDPAAIDTAIRADAVAFTSSSTVDRMIELVGRDAVPPLVVTIGPVTSRSVRAAGLHVTAEASEHTIAGLVAAVTAAVSTPTALP